MKLKSALCAAFACMSLSFSAAAQPVGDDAPPSVYAPALPPPTRRDIPVPPPGPRERYVWDRGHHEWNGRAYFWVPGHYVERPEPGLIWVRGRWAPFHRGWRWIGGHWRR